MATIRWKLIVSYWGIIIPTLISSPILHEQIGMQAWLDGYHQMEAECKLLGYNHPYTILHEQIGMQVWLDGYHQMEAECKLLGCNYPNFL